MYWTADGLTFLSNYAVLALDLHSTLHFAQYLLTGLINIEFCDRLQ